MHISPQAATTRSVRTRRVRLIAAVLAVPALVAAGISPSATAAPALGAADEAVVQYQVAPNSDSSRDALAQSLLAAGYDVYGGGDGALFVHAPASAGVVLAARTDLSVLAANTQVIDFGQVAPAGQDAVLPARLDGVDYATFYGGYRTADAFVEFTEDLAVAYPELVKTVKYGDTFTGANDLRAVCITSGADASCGLDPAVDKARFLLAGQIHARELSTSELTWRMMSYLVDGYGQSADVTAMLDETEFWVVPQINPDGVETVQQGITEDGTGSTSNAWQRKNLNPGTIECGTGSGSQIGVDLNRNFASNYGGAGTSTFQCSLVYRGTGVASEPETDTTQDLIRDLFEDQRGPGVNDPAPPTTRGALISLHSYSNLVLFPYGDSRTTPNDAGLRSMGFRMSDYNGYETGQANEILYEVTGSTDDFSYEKLGIAAFTYEIGPGSGACAGFFPAYSCQDTFWQLNRDAVLYGAAAAQQPYTQALGPTTSQARARDRGTNRAKVTAFADDDAYGASGVGRPTSQNVTAGRVFLDAAPWDGGTPKAMTVVGSGEQVDLQTRVRRAAQERYAWVQARDAQGNWGPVDVVWINARA